MVIWVIGICLLNKVWSGWLFIVIVRYIVWDYGKWFIDVESKYFFDVFINFIYFRNNGLYSWYIVLI